MTDEQTIPVTIYVLPSVPNMPPRAVVGQDIGFGVVGQVATWSHDVGTWLFPDGQVPVPELAEAMTQHAKNLGVQW